MAVTPGAHGYQLPNGQWVAPTEDFGYGQNPFDPETQPALYQKWEFEHQGDAQQIGQDYSPGRVGAIIGGTVAAGALGDLAAGGAAGGVSGGGSSTGLVGGAGTIADTPPFVLPASTAGTLGSLSAPAAATAAAPAIASPVTFGAGGAMTPGAAAAQTAQDVAYGGAGGAYGGATASIGTSFLHKLAPFLGLGADVVGAILGAKAAGQATDQLTAAGKQAQADLNKVYGGTTRTLGDVAVRQQQNLAPYTSLGSGAASLLGYGLGIPGVQAAPSGVYTPPQDPFGASSGAPLGSTPVLPHPESQPLPPSQPFPGVTSQVRPVTGPTTGTAVPRGTLSNMARLDAQQQTQSSYVTMRAPTGETQAVPSEHVAFYQQRGAQVVA